MSIDFLTFFCMSTKNNRCKKFYDGYLKSGKANGFEVHIWSNGNKYDDEWQKDREKVTY